MKKTILFLAAGLCIFACQTNKLNPEPISPDVKGGMVLTANIEQPVSTKATIDNALQSLWSTGDVIRVYISNNANNLSKVESFELTSPEGSAYGQFECATDYPAENNHWDYYSFFPYNYTTSSGPATTESNMGGDSKFYFCLPTSYYDYTSGRSFLPLLADMRGANPHPTNVAFYHVGGAVVLNLTKVPAAAHSLGMTVAGKKLNGWMNGIALDNLNSDDGAIIASPSDVTEENSIWMNFNSSGSEDRDMKFVFPVPTTTSTSNLTFTIYDKNNLKIWEKTASNQPAIGRAKAIVMRSRDVKALPSDLYVRGWINNADITANEIPLGSTGSIDYTFTSDSYLYLYASSINKAYLPGSNVSDSNQAECYVTDSWDISSCYKLKVPAGKYRLSINYNTTGTITLIANKIATNENMNLDNTEYNL